MEEGIVCLIVRDKSSALLRRGEQLPVISCSLLMQLPRGHYIVTMLAQRCRSVHRDIMIGVQARQGCLGESGVVCRDLGVNGGTMLPIIGQRRLHSFAGHLIVGRHPAEIAARRLIIGHQGPDGDAVVAQDRTIDSGGVGRHLEVPLDQLLVSYCHVDSIGQATAFVRRAPTSYLYIESPRETRSSYVATTEPGVMALG